MSHKTMCVMIPAACGVMDKDMKAGASAGSSITLDLPLSGKLNKLITPAVLGLSSVLSFIEMLMLQNVGYCERRVQPFTKPRGSAAAWLVL